MLMATTDVIKLRVAEILILILSEHFTSIFFTVQVIDTKALLFIHIML